MARKLVLVSDPGIDGAFALALAMHDPDLDVLGVAASAGNVNAEQATKNVQILVEQADPARWPRLGAALPVEYDIDGTQLHGDVVEVMGRTEPGAALIINGEEVADIKSDGTFRYFTPVMTRGSHEIVITGQNRRGGTAIKRVEVVIP